MTDNTTPTGGSSRIDGASEREVARNDTPDRSVARMMHDSTAATPRRTSSAVRREGQVIRRASTRLTRLRARATDSRARPTQSRASPMIHSDGRTRAGHIPQRGRTADHTGSSSLNPDSTMPTSRVSSTVFRATPSRTTGSRTLPTTSRLVRPSRQAVSGMRRPGTRGTRGSRVLQAGSTANKGRRGALRTDLARALRRATHGMLRVPPPTGTPRARPRRGRPLCVSPTARCTWAIRRWRPHSSPSCSSCWGASAPGRVCSASPRRE